MAIYDAAFSMNNSSTCLLDDKKCDYPAFSWLKFAIVPMLWLKSLYLSAWPDGNNF